MRARHAVTAACLLLAPPPAPHRPAPAAQEAPLKVLVYNIHAGKDADGVSNLARVARVINDAAPDLVLLQEVDRGTSRSDRVDQLAELARRTGLTGTFGKTLDYQGGEYGIGVLSRATPLSHHTVPLPVERPPRRADGSRRPRGALVVSVPWDTGVVHVVNTHLHASPDDRVRYQEAATVRALADSLAEGGDWVLVGGDFNADPDTRVIAAMTRGPWRDAWVGCGTTDGFTFSAAEPRWRIDYLFVPPGLDCAAARVIDADASDHRPVLLELAVRGGPPRTAGRIRRAAILLRTGGDHP